MKLAVQTELDAALEAVTEQDVERAARGFTKQEKGEKALGVIHNMEARRLWACSFMIAARAAETAVRAKFAAKSDDDQKRLLAEVVRLGALQELLKDTFWIQVKDDIGQETWEATSVGVRVDWMLVEGRPKADGLVELLQQLGG